MRAKRSSYRMNQHASKIMAAFLVFVIILTFVSWDFFTYRQLDQSSRTRNSSIVMPPIASQSVISSAKNEPVVTKSKSKTSSLYDDSDVVQEISSDKDYFALTSEESDPSLVVFYAPWCPHCKHFVPVYNKIAKTSRAEGGGGAPSFLAVNCDQFGKVCQDTAKITAFPTVIAYNFKTSDSSKSKEAKETRLKGTERDIMQFLDKHRHRVVQPVRETPIEHSPGRTGTFPDGVPTPIVKSDETSIVLPLPIHLAGRVASRDARFHDAVSSLLFLLTMELPLVLDQPKIDTLTRLFKMLLLITPSSNHRDVKDLWKTLLSIVTVGTGTGTTVAEGGIGGIRGVRLRSVHAEEDTDTLTHKIKAAVEYFITRTPEKQLTWSVCGLEAMQTSFTASQAPYAHELSNTPQSQSQSLEQQSLEHTNESPEDQSTRGFTCGMWFLFHILTVSCARDDVASVYASAYGGEEFNAHTVMRTIFDVIDHFFPCDECRGHFIQVYPFVSPYTSYAPLYPLISSFTLPLPLPLPIPPVPTDRNTTLVLSLAVVFRRQVHTVHTIHTIHPYTHLYTPTHPYTLLYTPIHPYTYRLFRTSNVVISFP